jgi:hypothetical protein
LCGGEPSIPWMNCVKGWYRGRPYWGLARIFHRDQIDWFRVRLFGGIGMTVLAGAAAGPGARRLSVCPESPWGMVRGRCRRLSSCGDKKCVPTVSFSGGDGIRLSGCRSKIFAAISRKMGSQSGLQCAGSWRDTGQCRGLAPACHSPCGQKGPHGIATGSVIW